MIEKSEFDIENRKNLMNNKKDSYIFKVKLS